MFPPSARNALAEPETPGPLHRAGAAPHLPCASPTVGVAVPVFGFATAKNMGVLGDTWLIVSIALTALAAVVLAALVLPRQTALMEGMEESIEDGVEGGGQGAAYAGASRVGPRYTARLAMFTGLFNLLWATVTILMIVSSVHHGASRGSGSCMNRCTDHTIRRRPRPRRPTSPPWRAG